MVPVRDKKIIIREKLILFLLIFLKIHFQFQQALPKRYISCHGVYVTYFQILSVYATKRMILALKLRGGLSILLITCSVLGGLSLNCSNVTREI